MLKSTVHEKIYISFFEACFLILYFHACVCIYVTYMNKLVFKPTVHETELHIKIVGIKGFFMLTLLQPFKMPTILTIMSMIKLMLS